MEFERSSRAVGQLNLTPLIDVVFLLIVFFMLTSTFLRTESMELSFPSGVMSAPASESPLVIVVGDRDRLFMKNQPIERGELGATLAPLLEDKPDQRIVIMSTNRVSVQELVSVMDEVYKVGGSNVSVSSWEY